MALAAHAAASRPKFGRSALRKELNSSSIRRHSPLPSAVKGASKVMNTMIQEARPQMLVHGFVDVLRLGAEWPAADKFEPGSYTTGRRRLPLPDGPVTVESISLSGDTAGQVTLPGDEFVLVVSGSVTFHQKEQSLCIGEGEAAVLLRDAPLQWATDQAAELVVMRCTAGVSASAARPVLIDTCAPLSPSNPPLANLLIGPTPSCRNHSDFRSESGEFVCGTWDSTPYHRRLTEFRHFELMRLMEGEVTFVDGHGQSGSFRAGDVVLFVQGGAASWESHSHVKKIYATYRPAQN